MPTPGRNESCPCGSGQKYKKCCGRPQPPSQSMLRRNAVSRALEWLLQHHRRALGQAIQHEFLEGLSEAQHRALTELPDDLGQMVMTNGDDWLIAEAELVVEGERRKVSELVLGPKGPLLPVEDRAYLAAFGQAPLRLWEVQEVKRGEGLWLKDLLEPKAEPVWVVEVSASESLEQWAVLAARRVQDRDQWVLTGGVYPFHRLDLAALRAEIRRALAPKKMKDHAWLAQAELSRVLRRRWLDTLTLPRKPPNLVDRASGEPLILVTDRYRVKDWGVLADRLALASDVEGDHKKGWVRVHEDGEGQVDVLLAVNVERNNHVSTFARTLRRAEEGRPWFERLAGDAVSFVAREIVDPTSVMNRPGSSEPPPMRPPNPELATTEVAQAIYQQTYRTWANDPIPALGGQTPREAVRSKAGRQAVIDLLKTYELGEAQRATEENRQPASLEFLWQAVGLSR